MVIFVTELDTNYYAIQFIKENGCDLYYKHHRGMLFEETREEILSELNEMEQEMREKE